MQQELSTITGATPTGLPRSAGSRCCSTDAKYESQSTNRAVRGFGTAISDAPGNPPGQSVKMFF